MTKIYCARWVLPVASPPFEDGAVAVEGSLILDVGTRAELMIRLPEAEVLDFKEAAILPGLVNTHSHLELTAMRGYLEREEGDFFALPPWAWHEHANESSEDVILFSTTDAPVLESLHLFEEHEYPGDSGHQPVIGAYEGS